MRSVLKILQIQTEKDLEFIDLTPQFKEIVDEAGIADGLALVMTMHTTTAITVNEGLPDLEEDLQNMLCELVSAEKRYRHNQFLHSDGQMAVNAPSHLRGALLGFEAFFPVKQGKPIMGGRQTIYLVELDGPLLRNVAIQVLGE